ncbi:major facilitator superfamily domain-containing protein [Lophiotrema nucula]|uniref:Major facilitator superfamily domain-containing protein n=1 Tax=Lophiotrema nucula TaxID=690887 RepID=A0A6A5Z852_9PLEO|nr:major facilitator superfamily domain-containing protein [Lophiotrema nucula]
MVRWVPTCMLLWGVATALHVWVRRRWELFVLRGVIGCLEAGFYPVTVSYLSLFYTRFEFGRRLSLFYGQAAVGGALGGIISYFVFTAFPHHDHGGEGDPDLDKKWQSWQVLFLFEGGLTMITAVVGYFWLPHSVETAWFLTPEQRKYASERVIADRAAQTEAATHGQETDDVHDGELDEESGLLTPTKDVDEQDQEHDEEQRGLLNSSQVRSAASVDKEVTNEQGLSPHDVVSAFTSPKIWHILVCNILSAIPVYAFQVFLPLVLAPLTDTPNPALVNLMTAPPYICGAITLYLFASYSDKHRKRILPILCGLALLLLGLTLVVALPTSKGWAIPRYIALNVLLSGCFIASPLTVAWISGNTPSPGKRALLLGINGWGNLAGVLSALLFRPKYAKSGYIVPFWWTLVCVGVAATGYVLFWKYLQVENANRRQILQEWSAYDIEKERVDGRGPLERDHQMLKWATLRLRGFERLQWAAEWLEQAVEGGREGDEKITFQYGL